MKSTVDTFNVTNTMGGEEVEMAIRPEDTVHLMAVLTDLYKNRLLAVIREYSTNAWDAHIDSNISLPIEVTLPSGMSPSLVIRDFGTGLDADDIRTIYSQYGRSTKRGSNDQVGMLGLGCKSALTYTTQFTVSSVKGGRVVTVLVSRKEDGAGTMQILGDEPTDAANGTTVTIAIRREDHSRCDQLAHKFYSYWPIGSVLVGGRAPSHFTSSPEILKLTDTLYLDQRTGAESKIVMGNVPYTHNIQLGVESDAKLIAFVPIGAVRPTPSRESLMDTANTANAVDGIVKAYHAAIEGAIQTEVTNAPTSRAAIEAIIKWEKYIPKDSKLHTSYVWQGHSLPDPFELPDGPTKDYNGKLVPNNIRASPFRDTNRKSYIQYLNKISVKDWNKMIWVTNYTPATFTALHKNKLLAWADSNDFRSIPHRYGVYHSIVSATITNGVQYFVLLPNDAPDSVFLDKNRIVDWEVIKAIKLTPATKAIMPNGTARIPGSYDIFTEDGYKPGTPGSDIRQDKPIIYARGNRWVIQRYNDALKLMYPEFSFVGLGDNRVAKFQRDVPDAIHINDALFDGYKKWEKTVSADDIAAVALDDACSSRPYRSLDQTKVDDPELVKMIEISKRDASALREARKTFKKVLSMKTLDRITDILSEEYPLYSEFYVDHEHTYAYLNMAYAMKLAKP